MAEALSTKEPVDVIEAQSSIPFATVTGVFKGGVRTLKEFVLFEDIKRAMGNPMVRSLLERTTIRGDASFAVQKGNAQVTIRLKDGKAYTKRVDIIRGSPENPFTPQELRERFLSQAGEILPRGRLVKAADLMERLEEVKKVEEITCLLF